MPDAIERQLLHGEENELDILVAHFGPESLQQRPATRPELALHPKDFFASHVREMGSLAHRQNVGMARRTEQMVEANLDELSEPLLGPEHKLGRASCRERVCKYV